MHTRDDIKVNFNWSRNHLFDRASVVILFERCLDAETAEVVKVQEKPTKKWKPLPLTTVELQKMATRFLRMTGQQAMKAAESLYEKGFISYPRTETDRFDRAMDLRTPIGKQTQDNRWGEFAQNLMDGGFQQPRQGRNDDKAHPPIHPITYAAPSVLNDDQRRVYELVVRRFLACCSEDAKGVSTDIGIAFGDETFNAHGVVVLERNYLDVYPYEKWTGTAELPKFTVGEIFVPTEAMMTEGKTTPPNYLTEADLIALMDANGIGTDATMAEHIQKIQDREYARTVEGQRRGGAGDADDEDDSGGDQPVAGGRAARGNRGRRGGRGGRGGARGGRGGGGGGGVRQFVPTSLGVALILGFDRMNFETSLGKPFLRREMELKMKAICEGRSTKQEVLHESLSKYRQVFDQSQEQLSVLKAVSSIHTPPPPWRFALLCLIFGGSESIVLQGIRLPELNTHARGKKPESVPTTAVAGSCHAGRIRPTLDLFTPVSTMLLVVRKATFGGKDLSNRNARVLGSPLSRPGQNKFSHVKSADYFRFRGRTRFKGRKTNITLELPNLGIGIRNEIGTRIGIRATSTLAKRC